MLNYEKTEIFPLKTETRSGCHLLLLINGGVTI